MSIVVRVMINIYETATWNVWSLTIENRIRRSNGDDDAADRNVKVGEYWPCPHGMWRRVWVTVRCPSVHLSVRLSVHHSTASAAGLLLSAVRAGDIDRQQRTYRTPSNNGAAARATARRSAANAGSAMLTAELTDLCLSSNVDLSHTLRISYMQVGVELLLASSSASSRIILIVVPSELPMDAAAVIYTRSVIPPDE